MIQTFNNIVSALWRSYWKNIHLLTLSLYAFLIFFVIWYIMSNNMPQRAWKVSSSILLDIREKSEFLLVPNPKFDMKS